MDVLTSNQEGPRVTVDRSCRGCHWHQQERYQVQGDSGYDHYCTHGGSKRDTGSFSAKTPDWCPVTRAAHEPAAVRREMEIVMVHGKSLSVTHICDGEEVITGGEDGQVWVATFADPTEALAFVQRAKYSAHLFKGERASVTKEAPREATPTLGPRYCDCTSFCMRQSKNIDPRLCKAARAGIETSEKYAEERDSNGDYTIIRNGEGEVWIRDVEAWLRNGTFAPKPCPSTRPHSALRASQRCRNEDLERHLP